MSIRRGTQGRAGLGKPGSLAVGGLVTTAAATSARSERSRGLVGSEVAMFANHVDRRWAKERYTPKLVGTQTDAMGTAEGFRTIDCKPYKPWGTKV